MNDKNKYNNALEKLQEALAPKDGREISGLTRGCIESIFPELKESEDERIRKEIIEYIKTGTYHKDWIAWLEKQGDKPQGKTALESIKEKPADNANKVASAWNNGYSNGYIQAIEKAVEWLENHNDYIDVKDGNVTYFDMEKCVEDFRKAMEGGEE